MEASAQREARPGQPLAAGSGPARAVKAVTLLVFDAIWLYGSALASAAVVAHGGVADYALIAPLLTLSGISLFAATGVYRPDQRPPIPIQAERIAACMLFLGLVVTAATSLAQPAARALPAGLVPVWAVAGGVGAALARLVWYLAVRHEPAAATHPAFVVGTPERVREVLAARDRNAHAGATPAGIFLLDGNAGSTQIAGVPVLGGVNELPEAVRANGIETVLIAVPAANQNSQERILETIAPLDMDGYLLLAELPPAPLPDRHLNFGPFRVVHAQKRPLYDIQKLLKRAFDLFVGGAATLAAAPVLLIAALAIKLETRGPVLFKQPRYGYNDALVTIYKFRTMYHTDTDTRARRATRPDDPRVTRVGRVLRRTSLDELPQLFNVLQGRMSVVGPRPHAPESTAGGWYFRDAVPAYAARHRVKPGITGAAQVSGWRGPTETLDKLECRVDHDLWYIHNWSLALDVRIVLRTPFALIGANTF